MRLQNIVMDLFWWLVGPRDAACLNLFFNKLGRHFNCTRDNTDPHVNIIMNKDAWHSFILVKSILVLL